MLSFSRGTLLSGHCHGLDQLLRDHAAQLLPRAGPDVLHPVRQRACADVGGDAVAAQAHGQPHHEADRLERKPFGLLGSYRYILSGSTSRSFLLGFHQHLGGP